MARLSQLLPCLLAFANASRITVQDQVSPSRGDAAAELCCCNVTAADQSGQEKLVCQRTEGVGHLTSLMLVSHCPAGTTHVGNVLPAALSGVRGSQYFGKNRSSHVGRWGYCHVSMALGPPARPCQGVTASCECDITVDARVPSNGYVKGRVLTKKSAERTVAGFFGLRYAMYTGRWEHSKSLEDFTNWKEAEQTTDHCSSKFLQQLRTHSEIHDQFCFQWLPALGRFGTEPCLTLDVYTPAVVKTPGSSAASPFRLAVESGLPVMVFIEGGGFLVGDKYQQGIYDARKLAQKQNIIVVSVNYRLGVFGWLHHPYLKNEAGEVLANFGLRDQLQALKWVQTNIAAFGGDPSHVTLAGESAGAMSICAHLASPTSRGFFHSAVLESGNCDGLFIWQPRKYAEDYGLRYIRGVFGRVRGCYLSELSHNTTYKASENGCSKEDTAPMKLVRDMCRNLFFGGYEEVTIRAMAEILPFENVGGCDTDYRGCKVDLPSGLQLDQALLRCAERLPTKYVWVNQFGLIHHYTRSDSSYISHFMGMGWFGAPPPPHLPWAPIVDLDLQGELDFAAGSGLASLPLHSYEGMNSKLQMRTITAGFNRDEGSLFYLLLPNFFSGIETKNGLSDADYRKLLKSMACPDWGPACTKPGCVEPAECEERVDTAVKAYQWDPSVSALRGRCCSTDPNILRVQRMLTDMLFVCPNFRFLQQMHNHSDATLRTYQFAADDEVPAWLPPLRSLLGAFHFSELFFVMGDKEGPGGNLPLSGGALGFGLGWTKEDVKISANMSGSWGALVRGEELPSWPTWDSGQMTRFALGVPDNVDIMPRESMRVDHHCDFFDALNRKLINDVS